MLKRDRWKILQNRFERRRSRSLADRLSSKGRFDAALKDVRVLNRTIEQVFKYMRDEVPEIADMVSEITVSRGLMLFICEDDGQRYFVDQWVRSHRTEIQGVCSKPPKEVKTKCSYRPSE